MMRRAWLPTFLVVLLAGQLGVGMRASRSASVTGDEPFYLLTAQSLRSDGDLDLTDEYRNGEEAEFWDGTIPLWKQMEPTSDGRLLSPHQTGLSLLILPAYVAGGLRGVQRFLVVLWAAAMACAAVLARRAGAPAWAAFLAATAVGVGAPGVVYASQVYPEGPAALCVGLGLLAATAKRPRPVLLATVVVALAWLGVKYVPLGALVAGAWAWRFRADRRTLLTAGAAVLAAAVHFTWWHLHTFGGLTPYSTNVVWAGEGTAAIVGDHLSTGRRSYRLYGLFLDARFGLFRWLPVAILAVYGVGRRVLPHMATVAICLLMGTFVSITMMGWWFPGRMLVAGFPALVVLVAIGASRLPHVSVALTGWSLAIAAGLVWAARRGDVYLAVNPFDLGAPLPPAWLFPDFRSFTARQALQSAAWAGALLAVALARRAGLGRRQPAPARALAPRP
ncbi:MAG TPA: hypothetical protein VEI97_10625 [bacterium]|nr:hypothetical protein [bacterium]